MDQNHIYALGFFDGVHLGHGALLKQCRAMADTAGCRAGVVTFYDHPDTLVYGKTPPLINTREDRKMLLTQQYHMDTVIELPFDRQMMSMPWQDFFHLLCQTYHAAGLVCGEDFRFGKRGEGNSALLQKACQDAGIPCAVIPQQQLDGIPVSSTYIRTLLEAGKMEQAVRFLGHPHILSGKVVPGHQLGRTIGIPTANLYCAPDGVALRHGVYACKAIANGTSYLCVTNVGSRPTVGGSHITIEPWLLDFDGDLYGKTVILEFYRFLRAEKKFPSLDALREEILKNAEETRKFFENT